MKFRRPTFTLLMVIGIASIVLYGYALWLKDLRLNTIPFEWVFFAAFGLYALAAWQVLQENSPTTRRLIILIFGFAVLFRAILIFSHPTLSDDMYRYIWDGRVQAHQLNPYLYPPSAPELANLRDQSIWPLINRKSVVTVYPAGAELAFAAIWRIWPDNVHGFQAVMVFGDLIAALLLVFILRALGRSPGLVLIYLWNPLVIFELAHSAHVDGLVLPFLVGAWLAKVKGRDALTGFLLGIAASLKLYPVLLLPVLWGSKDEKGRFQPAWVMPLAFLIGFSMPYLPYLTIGKGVLGFLPGYFHENGNMFLSGPIYYLVSRLGGQPELVINGLIAVLLVVVYLFFVFHPAENAETVLRRSIWPIGIYTLLTTNLYPWYILWLTPLIAIAMSSRKDENKSELATRLLHTSWTGWWLFSGTIALSYVFYVHLSTDIVAQVGQFILLLEFLIIDFYRWFKNIFPRLLTWRPVG